MVASQPMHSQLDDLNTQQGRHVHTSGSQTSLLDTHTQSSSHSDDTPTNLHMALALGGISLAAAATTAVVMRRLSAWQLAHHATVGLPPFTHGYCKPRRPTAVRLAQSLPAAPHTWPRSPLSLHHAHGTSTIPLPRCASSRLRSGTCGLSAGPAPPQMLTGACSTSGPGSYVTTAAVALRGQAADGNGSGWQQAGSSGSGSSGGWSSWASSLLGPALLLPAAAATAVTTALAEAPGSPWPAATHSTSAKGGAGNAGSGGGGDGEGRSALQVAQQVLSAAWGDVQHDMQRINAELRSGAPPLKGTAPQVTSRTSEGREVLEVTIPVRQGCDVHSVMSTLKEAFRPVRGGSISQKSRIMGASRLVQLDVVSGSAGGGGEGTSVVRAQLFLPPPAGEGQAEVTVQKRVVSGPGAPAFTQQELQGLSELVRAANLALPHGAPDAWGAFEPEDVRRHGLGAQPDMDSFMRQFKEDVFHPFLGGILHGGMGAIMQEMQRMMEELQEEGGEQEYSQRGGDSGLGQAAPGRLGQAARREEPEEVQQWGSREAAAAVKQLQALGAQVFPPGDRQAMDWGVLAGYESQKRMLEDCLLLPLQRPDVYTRVAEATRAHPGSNRPRAVLFEGPPGTGKTTSARVISTQAAVPLVYLPLEAVLSKWYGESEGQLAKVFKAAVALGGAIIFIDELDALGGSRERGDLHEASRRLLSVLLREMDGFDAAGARAVVIGATNRKADLDPALTSRFDMSITFGLPDRTCRAQILAQFARQLSDEEHSVLASETPGMSGRDLRDVCEVAERRWASKIIRGEVPDGSLPQLADYMESARERLLSLKKPEQPSFGPVQWRAPGSGMDRLT